MTVLENEDELYSSIKKEDIVILQFGEASCGPCHDICDKITAFCRSHPKIKFIYIPVEKFPKMSALMNVFTVPYVSVYVKGKMSFYACGCFSLLEIFQRTERYEELISE